MGESGRLPISHRAGRGAQTGLVTPLHSIETQFLSEIHLEESVWRENVEKVEC